jgi:hypothetical protein
MTVAQVEHFVSQCLAAREHVRSVKVVGGEPMLTPDFPAIYDILACGIDAGAFCNVRISTNRARPIPAFPHHRAIRWMGTDLKRKRHQPYLWSPVDLGYTVAGPCRMPFRCGISLDAYGYLPCSAAIMIARGFGLEHLYRRELPDGVWGMDELCRHCIHGMPGDWQRKHSFPAVNPPPEAVAPTSAWQAALPRALAWQPPPARWPGGGVSP